MKRGKDVGVAIVEEGPVGSCDAEVIDGGRSCEGEIKEGVAKEWTVGEVAIEPADRVEGRCEVVASAPYFGRVESK